MPQDERKSRTQTDMVATMMLLGVVGAVLILVGLIGAFTVIADGINQSPDDLAAHRSASVPTSEASPPAGDVDAASGASVALTPSADYVALDLRSCRPGETRLNLAGGVITFNVFGHDKSDCILDYGDDAASPGTITMACRIPSELSALQLPVQGGRADLSAISRYCGAI
jgi:hypothetical protein